MTQLQSNLHTKPEHVVSATIASTEDTKEQLKKTEKQSQVIVPKKGKVTPSAKSLAQKAHLAEFKEKQEKIEKDGKLFPEKTVFASHAGKPVSVNGKALSQIKEEYTQALEKDIQRLGPQSAKGKNLATFLLKDASEETILAEMIEKQFRKGRVLQNQMNRPELQALINDAKKDPVKHQELVQKAVIAFQELLEVLISKPGVDVSKFQPVTDKDIAHLFPLVDIDAVSDVGEPKHPITLPANTSPELAALLPDIPVAGSTPNTSGNGLGATTSNDKSGKSTPRIPSNQNYGDAAKQQIETYKILQKLLLLLGSISNKSDIAGMHYADILGKENLSKIEKNTQKEIDQANKQAHQSTCHKIIQAFEFIGAIIAVLCDMPMLAVMLLVAATGLLDKATAALAKATGSKVLADVIMTAIMLIATMGAGVLEAALEIGEEVAEQTIVSIIKAVMKTAFENLMKDGLAAAAKTVLSTLVMDMSMSGLMSDIVCMIGSGSTDPKVWAKNKSLMIWAAVISAGCMLLASIASISNLSEQVSKLGRALKNAFNSIADGTKVVLGAIGGLLSAMKTAINQMIFKGTKEEQELAKELQLELVEMEKQVEPTLAEVIENGADVSRNASRSGSENADEQGDGGEGTGPDGSNVKNMTNFDAEIDAQNAARKNLKAIKKAEAEHAALVETEATGKAAKTAGRRLSILDKIDSPLVRGGLYASLAVSQGVQGAAQITSGIIQVQIADIQTEIAKIEASIEEIKASQAISQSFTKVMEGQYRKEMEALGDEGQKVAAAIAAQMRAINLLIR